MIDQTTKIEQRIETIENAEEREKYDSLKEQANVSWEFNDVCSHNNRFYVPRQAMLDHIKHSIVLLQIAKVKVRRFFATTFIHNFPLLSSFS